MKIIIGTFFTFIILVVFAINYMNNKIGNLINLADSLKTSNVKLTKQNKKLHKLNTKLTKTNKKLIARKKHIHNRITKRRKKLTSMKLSKIKDKLITAGPKMTPIIGISTIIASTTYDVNNYCKEIEEMENFEYQLFGDQNIKKDKNKICGVNVKNELEQTGKNVKDEYNVFIKSLKKEYEVTEGFWTTKINDFSDAVDKNNNQVSKYWHNIFN